MSDDGRRSIGTLLRDLAEGSTALVRDEVKLARLEVAETAASVGKSAAFVAAGAVLVLLGALSLLTGMVLLIGDQWVPADRYWVGALLMLVLTAGLGLWLAKRGMAMLSPSRLKPDETIETLEEDKEWLKRRLTSAATSS